MLRESVDISLNIKQNTQKTSFKGPPSLFPNIQGWDSKVGREAGRKCQRPFFQEDLLNNFSNENRPSQYSLP